jgi:trimeric autotransporter adhesin
MLKKLWAAIFFAVILTSCTKKANEADIVLPPVVTIPERLEIAPTTSSMLIGQTSQFTLTFYNSLGVVATLPAGVVWSSSNTASATVSQTGLVTAIGLGQTNIKATYNNISATAVLSVVVNNNALANITITPAATQEILLNGTINFSAVGTNLGGCVVSGLTFNWTSNASSSVQLNTAGVATGLTYGSANIVASANGIQSAPTMVQVIRQGNFVGQNSAGMAKLKIENGTLKLQTSSTFSVASAPDLRIYLTNTPTTNAGAVQIAPLSTVGHTSGIRTWNVPSNVTITQYRYALVWCAQFGGVYGIADLGL